MCVFIYVCVCVCVCVCIYIYIYIHKKLNHFAVHQNLTQHCKKVEMIKLSEEGKSKAKTGWKLDLVHQLAKL